MFQERAEPGPIICMLTTDSVVIILVISLLSHSPYAYRMMDDQKSDCQAFSIAHAMRAGPESVLQYLFALRKNNAIVLLSRVCIIHKGIYRKGL